MAPEESVTVPRIVVDVVWETEGRAENSSRAADKGMRRISLLKLVIYFFEIMLHRLTKEVNESAGMVGDGNLGLWSDLPRY